MVVDSFDLCENSSHTLIIPDNGDSSVESANDPGIIMGFDVIDANTYNLVKVQAEGGGTLTRLVHKDRHSLEGEGNIPDRIIVIKENKSIIELQKAHNFSEDQEKKLVKKMRIKEAFKGKKRPKTDEIFFSVDNTMKRRVKQTKNINKFISNLSRPSLAEIELVQTLWCTSTEGVYLHPHICSTLVRRKYQHPTPIQASTLAASILGRRDIVGSAPTGSGKTLCYVLPILQYLMEALEKNEQGSDSKYIDKPFPLIALVLCPTRELALQVSSEFKVFLDNTTKRNRLKIGTFIGGLAVQKQKRVLDVERPPIIIGTPGRLWELISSKDHDHLKDLSNIRFLVVDEVDRMVSSNGNFPDFLNLINAVKIANPPLSLPYKWNHKMRSESGYKNSKKEFKPDCETKKSQNTLYVESEKSKRIHRQTFLFSATLALSSSLNSLLQSKNKDKNIQYYDTLKNVNNIDISCEIFSKIGVCGEVKFVDLSSPLGCTHSNICKNERWGYKWNNKLGFNAKGTKQHSVETPSNSVIAYKIRLPPGLFLYEMKCTQKHKDSYLYAYLITLKHGLHGSCLVFCNSIKAVKRVNQTLRTLGLPVRALHAHIKQKARMTALESIKTRDNHAIVVATDVAARGLDITSVTTVIHYDVARSIEIFIHRAGRTARGVDHQSKGVSLSLVSVSEESSHAKLCEGLYGEGIKNFNNAQIDGITLFSAQKRVSLASKIVLCDSLESRTCQNNGWFLEAAANADIDVDSDWLDRGLKVGSWKVRQRLLQSKQAKLELSQLLEKPIKTGILNHSFQTLLCQSI